MARSEKVNQQMKEERKERIQEEALKLFAIQGLSATKISHIAKATGMSQGLMYHYYDAKESIYIDLIKIAYDRMEKASIQLLAMEGTALEKINLVIDQMYDGIQNNIKYGYQFLLLSHASVNIAIPEEAKKIIATKGKVHYKAVEEILIQGQKEGTLKDFLPEDLALLFWTSINGLAINRAIQGDSFKAPNKEIILNMIFKLRV